MTQDLAEGRIDGDCGSRSARAAEQAPDASIELTGCRAREQDVVRREHQVAPGVLRHFGQRPSLGIPPSPVAVWTYDLPGADVVPERRLVEALVLGHLVSAVDEAVWQHGEVSSSSASALRAPLPPDEGIRSGAPPAAAERGQTYAMAMWCGERRVELRCAWCRVVRCLRRGGIGISPAEAPGGSGAAPNLIGWMSSEH